MRPSPHDLQDLSVLLAYAHPDDEGFGTAAFWRCWRTAGARLTLVCATNGDVGEISDPALATPDTLAQVRQEELRQAMAVTGVQDVRFLNYRDSGMAGTDDNRHPNALMQAPPQDVIGRLVDVDARNPPARSSSPTTRPAATATRTTSPSAGTSPRRSGWQARRTPTRNSSPGAVSRGSRRCSTTSASRAASSRRMWQYLREAGIPAAVRQ